MLKECVGNIVSVYGCDGDSSRLHSARGLITSVVIASMLMLSVTPLKATAANDFNDDRDVEIGLAVESFSEAQWGEGAGNEGAEYDASEKESDFYTDYLSGRLEIGTRVTYTILTESDSGAAGGGQGEGTFLGTIYALDENQDYIPKNIFARYYFSKYIGIELAYDSVEAETVAPSDYTTTKTDGDVSLSGPTISLVGRYPNSSSFTPYVSLGIGFFSGDFEESADWALGYYDPAEYAALGSPSTSYNGVTRVMDVDDEIAVLFGIGIAYSFTEHFSLDMSLQYTVAEADATFSSYKYGTLTSEQDGSFPLDNVAVRAGLTYSF